MVTKQRKAINEGLLLEYYRRRFNSREEIENFPFMCIGPSRDSPMAGPIAKDKNGPKVSAGTRVNIKICSQMKCTCHYASRLIFFSKEFESDKEEKINAAKRIAVDEISKNDKQEQPITQSDESKCNESTEDQELEDLLFGD